jgi:hypothetical protein
MGKYSADNPCAVKICVQIFGADLERPMVETRDIFPISLKYTGKHGTKGDWFLEAYDFATDKTEVIAFKDIVKWGAADAVPS